MQRGALPRCAAFMLLTSAVLLSGPAMAQQPGPPANLPTGPTFGIGVIDIPAILRQSTAAQALQRQMQEEQDSYQAMTEERQRELQESEEAIERDRASLGAQAYADRRREFQERVDRTTFEFRARRRQIDEAFNDASGEINRTLLEVIEQLARDNGIGMVIRREAVLYQRSVLDVTAAAARALNEKLPEVEVALPAPPGKP